MQTVDYRQVKTAMAKAAGKEAPTFDRSLFWYTNFVYVEKDSYKVVSEKEATELMSRYSSKQLEVYHLKYPQSQTKVPSIITKRKLVQVEPCTSFELASEIIKIKTGVLVPEHALRGPDKLIKNTSPKNIITGIRSLKKSNHDRIVNLFECSAMAEAKKRMSIKNAKCKY